MTYVEWEDGELKCQGTFPISEKNLEDLCHVYLGEYIESELIGRQVTLPSGRRLDLLYMSHHDDVVNLTVVELKVVKLGVQDLLQLLRYVREIEDLAGPTVVVRGLLITSYDSETDADGRFSDEDVFSLVQYMDDVAMMDAHLTAWGFEFGWGQGPPAYFTRRVRSRYGADSRFLGAMVSSLVRIRSTSEDAA